MATSALAAGCNDESSAPSSTASGGSGLGGGDAGAAGAGATGGGASGAGGATGGAGGSGTGGASPSCQFEPGPISFVDWSEATPEAHGMSETALDDLWTDLESRGTAALLIIRDDDIVYERYAATYGRSVPHYTASLAKSVVGGVSLLVAMSDGVMEPDDRVQDYVPAWVGVDPKQDITVRHLATHTSGIEDAEQDGLPHDQLTGWKGDFWARLPPPDDPFSISRDLAPVLFEPGTAEHYSNPGMAMLSYAITGALQGEPLTDLRSLLSERIMGPIGIPADEWSCGYEETYQVGGLDLVAPWGGGSYSPNATARVGRLLLRCGDWDGEQLIAPERVVQSTRHAGTPAPSGLGFWVNDAGGGGSVSPSLPPDSYWGAGAGHQILLVVPSLGLIMVRNGSELASGDFGEALEQYLFAPLMAAVEGG
jgi:CubicO group peptidase (beta-lactamase class C family)